MTDADDKLSRRYREAAREEPGEDLDRAILAASRRAVGAGPRARGSRWMVPASIAAVLVLGVGVSLRMQMEEPGIETSLPAGSAEYPVPSADPAPAPPPASAQAPEPQAAPAAAPQAGTPPRSAAPRAQIAPPRAKERAQQDPPRPEPAPQPLPKLRKDLVEAEPRAEAGVASQPPMAAAPRAPSSPPAVAMSQSAPAAAPAPAPALRAKREAFAADSAGARESRAIPPVADPDPQRELERIARLREAGRHDEADRALEEFRRRHPDHRIPEATWERVKPR